MATVLNLNFNFDEVLQKHEQDREGIVHDLQTAVAGLAAQTHAHILESASSKLHSRLDEFREGLQFKQVNDNLWVITIPKQIRWIEDGQEAHSMLPDLLRSPKAKTAADGHKYLIIPFKHNKAPTRQTKFAQQITSVLRDELKRRGVPYQKIERGPDGNAQMGLIHDFKSLGGPKRPHWSNHALDGVRIYQREVQNKNGSKSVKRDIMTFRVASSKQMGLKWEHPGTPAMHFLEEAQDWAVQEWTTQILPAILAKY